MEIEFAASVFAVIVGFASLLLFWDWKKDVCPSGTKSAIPVAGWIPILGCGPAYCRDPVNYMHVLHRKHGGDAVVRLRMPGVGFMYSCFAEDWPKTFYTSSENAYSLYEAARDFFGPTLGREAFAKENVTHLAALRSRFTAKANNSIESMVAEVDSYVQQWDKGQPLEGEPVDLMQDLDTVVTRINSRCIVSDDLMKYPDLCKVVQKIINTVDSQAQFPLPVVSQYNLWRVRPALARLHEIFRAIMNDKKSNGSNDDKDLIDCLMRETDARGEFLDVDGVVPRAFSVLYAGGTTVKAVSNTLWMIASHPKVHAEVMQEQQKLFGEDRFCQPGIEDLKNMDVLDRCLRETLRLLSGTFQVRKAVKDMEFKGYHIPAGSVVSLSPIVYHHRKGVFSNPYVFDPDRHLPGREEGRKEPYEYYHGFGGGRHVCLGKSFAILQVKAFLSMIFRRFDVEMLGFPQSHSFLIPGIAIPSKPCKVLFTPKK